MTSKQHTFHTHAIYTIHGMQMEYIFMVLTIGVSEAQDEIAQFHNNYTRKYVTILSLFPQACNYCYICLTMDSIEVKHE